MIVDLSVNCGLYLDSVYVLFAKFLFNLNEHGARKSPRMKNALLPILLCMVLSVTFVHAQSSDKLNTEEQDVSVKYDHQFSQNKWDYFLYPVPAVDEVTIKVTKGQVTFHQFNITDEFGNDVMELTDLSVDKLKIDVSSLPSGKYFMQIIPEDKKSFLMKRFYIAN